MQVGAGSGRLFSTGFRPWEAGGGRPDKETGNHSESAESQRGVVGAFAAVAAHCRVLDLVNPCPAAKHDDIGQVAQAGVAKPVMLFFYPPLVQLVVSLEQNVRHGLRGHGAMAGSRTPR